MLGSGINTGMATVGLMGSNEHLLNYTVFGREVNLASRLEAVSGRGRIIISEATYEPFAPRRPGTGGDVHRLAAGESQGHRRGGKNLRSSVASARRVAV